MKETEVLEKIENLDLRKQVSEILRQNSREAYLDRLKRCGVILR